MAAQDRTEKVLRDIHVLFSKAEPYEGSAINVVVNKNEVMDLLKELNNCMYDMMEEYELTSRSHDKAKRELQKEGDDIIFDAQRKAEDIYAASIMYTDNTLNEIQEILKEARDRFDKIYDDTKEKVDLEVRQVRTNQTDLKSKLSDLIDTQKYLHLIEDENRRLAKEKESGNSKTEVSNDKSYSSVVPEIKINEEYFRAQGINPDGTPIDEDTLSDEEIKNMSNDLDSEYFDWKESEDNQDENGEKRKKGGFSLFGKK